MYSKKLPKINFIGNKFFSDNELTDLLQTEQFVAHRRFPVFQSDKVRPCDDCTGSRMNSAARPTRSIGTRASSTSRCGTQRTASSPRLRRTLRTALAAATAAGPPPF